MGAPILYHRLRQQYYNLLLRENLSCEEDTNCVFLLGVLNTILGSSGRPVVYIASAYSKGDRLANVMRQIEVGNELLRLGYIPIVPLLSHFWHEITPWSYWAWMLIDLILLTRAADFVLRLSGESEGADLETWVAGLRGIPVARSIQALVDRRFDTMETA